MSITLLCDVEFATIYVKSNIKQLNYSHLFLPLDYLEQYTMKKIYFLFSLLISFTLGFFWSRYYDQKLKKEKHAKRVGYIYLEHEGVVELDSVKTYGDKPLLGVYGGTAPEIYKGSKYQFKQNLLESYQAEKYNDNGYLNFRFYISNEGKVWLYQLKELTYDFQSTKFTQGLVDKLVDLCLKKDNWNPYDEENVNYYMHLTLRLENGKITEIIP